ncbi:Oxidoreductase [plant metagenome]|uniref:Oxidoreductase n=1 Tax=plant metagenome TaxID=1297885 RepID=A0A484RFE6_9ZZZZ
MASRRLIEQSGLPYTVLRVGCLSDYLLHRIPIALRSGGWPTSAAEGVGTFISREEATHAVAAALHSNAPSVGLVGVQGSQALSAQALVDTVKQVFGAHIELEPVDDDALLDGFTSAGVDALTATELVAVDRAMRVGSLDVGSGRSSCLQLGPVASVRDFLAHRRLDILLASKHGWPGVGLFSTTAASLQFP